MTRFVIRDKYFQKAKKEGYRARSAYKLKEIQERFKVIQRGHKVLDLGCAPGSFLQVISTIVGQEGLVVGIDILPVSPLPQKNVATVLGDIRDTDVVGLCATYASKGFDIVTCDIAPNLSGIREVDEKNVSDLFHAVLVIVDKGLKAGGHLVLKSFFSETFKATMTDLKKLFHSVSVYKPAASRAVSSETYLIALGKK